MVAITANQTPITLQSSNTQASSELRAVPEQEKTLNSLDNAVAAPQNPKGSSNETQSREQLQETRETREPPPAAQQLQRFAVESSATSSPSETPEPTRTTNEQEDRVQEDRVQEPEDDAPTITSEAPRTPPPGSASALSTYQQVSNLQEESPEPTRNETSSAPVTEQKGTPAEAKLATTERQVFGGAIDAPRSNTG